MSGTQWDGSGFPPDDSGVRVEASTAGRAVVVSLVGDVDVDARDGAQALFAKALAMKPAVLVVDVSQVTFCDSGGLNLLLTSHMDCQAADCRLILAGVGTQFHRLLDITGADEVFEMATTVPQALGE